MSEHPIVHVEFSAQDRQAAGKFYNELFGWKVQQIPEMNYATFETGSVAGGLTRFRRIFPPERWRSTSIPTILMLRSLRLSHWVAKPWCPSLRFLVSGGLASLPIRPET